VVTSFPSIARGQQAWGKLKATAAEQRKLWREVGEALLVGRKQNPSNQGFCTWLKDNGFNDIKRDTRADAMWLAEKWSVIGSPDNDITHPENIRKWFNENQQTSSLPEDLKDVEIVTKAVPERSFGHRA
jgi:hypothetical protein